MKRWFGGWAVLSLLLLVLLGPARAQQEEAEVKPKEVHAVRISDAEVIQTFRRGQLISPTIEIDSVEFIDVTRNGFGQGDLMIVFPQERVFPLVEINDTERAILNQYQWEENKTYSAPTLNVTEIQQDARLLESPFGGILSAVVKGVDYYYDGNYIQGIFRIVRDRDLATLTLWNYSEPEMNYRPGSPAGVADTLLNYDLLKMYIRELSTDTVYVPVLVPETAMSPGEEIPARFLPTTTRTVTMQPSEGVPVFESALDADSAQAESDTSAVAGEAADTLQVQPESDQEMQVPPPPSPVPADTANGIAPDSPDAPGMEAEPADTTAAAPDTTEAPSDTAGVLEELPADTTGMEGDLPPDTTSAEPDTAAAGE